MTRLALWVAPVLRLVSLRAHILAWRRRDSGPCGPAFSDAGSSRGWRCIAVVMTMHRLTAGSGYQYLMRSTASGDCDRPAASDLTTYYTASGNPPGRWYGRGLPGLADGGPGEGAHVTEEQMANLYGEGKDPQTGASLGRPYPRHTPAAERIAKQVAALPADLTGEARDAAVATITRVELAKRTATASRVST